MYERGRDREWMILTERKREKEMYERWRDREWMMFGT